MAATIYAPPEEIKPVDFDAYFGPGGLGSEDYFKAVKVFEQAVMDWCKKNGSGALAGKRWRYQIADGYASYVVYKTRPLTLIDVGDDYSIPELVRKGLTASALADEIERQERISSLFSESAA